MRAESPIWPCRLDHLRLDSDDPPGLVRFYCAALDYAATPLRDDTILLQAPGRRLVIGRGAPGGRPYQAFRVESPAQLKAIRDFLAEQDVALEKSPSSVFEPDAVAVRDPDGWLVVFGLERGDLPARPSQGLGPLSDAARLQHVVVASSNLPRLAAFYEEKLGFVPSDYCDAVPGDPATRGAAFYRSDPEHHSFAIFKGSSARPDHHAYETRSWNDIRDWADHMAGLRIRIFWGPGRHGPGNNLFFMIRDPHGQAVELSAELESMPREQAPRLWPMEERALNLWGPGWIRT